MDFVDVNEDPGDATDADERIFSHDESRTVNVLALHPSLAGSTSETDRTLGRTFDSGSNVPLNVARKPFFWPVFGSPVQVVQPPFAPVARARASIATFPASSSRQALQ